MTPKDFIAEQREARYAYLLGWMTPAQAAQLADREADLWLAHFADGTFLPDIEEIASPQPNRAVGPPGTTPGRPTALF